MAAHLTMVRLIAILVILGGIVAGFVWPSYVMRESGSELGRSTVYERVTDGATTFWRPANMRLTPRDNPMRISVEGFVVTGQRFPPTGAAMLISVAARGEIVIEGEFDLVSVDQGGNELSGRRASLVTPEFEVELEEVYTIAVAPIGSDDHNLEKVEVALRGSVETPDKRYRTHGYVAIGVGVLLLILSGRSGGRRSKTQRAGKSTSSTATRKPAKSPKPRKKKRRWGRQ